MKKTITIISTVLVLLFIGVFACVGLEKHSAQRLDQTESQNTIEKLCPKCGLKMIVVRSQFTYLTNPPQYDTYWYCGCGYTEYKEMVREKTEEEINREKWERENQ